MTDSTYGAMKPLTKPQMKALKTSVESTLVCSFTYGYYHRGNVHRRTIQALMNRGLIESVQYDLVEAYQATTAGHKLYQELFGPDKPWIDL